MAQTLEYQGETLTYEEIAERLNTCTSTISSRVQMGWPVERIVTEPAKVGRRPSLPDLVGEKFGLLTAVKQARNPSAVWCRCDCGREDLILRPKASLLKGRADGRLQSCGCVRSELSQQTVKPQPKTFVKFEGRTMGLVEAARAAGLDPNLVLGRVAAGWSSEKALSTPKGPKTYAFRGRQYSCSELAALPECQVALSCLRQRIQTLGWPIEKALTHPLQEHQQRFRNSEAAADSAQPEEKVYSAYLV